MNGIRKTPYPPFKRSGTTITPRTSGDTLAMGAGNITGTGSIADTTNRITKVWATDIESTNDITIGGTALASTYAAIAQTMYIGSTSVAINRGTGALALTGITSIDGSSASCVGNAATATTATSLAGGSGGTVPYQSSAGTTAMLANGTDGQYLQSNGTTVAPSWETIAAGGDVSKVGTPEDSQVGVWTGDGTIEGDASMTYDGSNLQLTGDVGSTGTKITKGWFTDLTVTNAIAGSVTGNAGTVSTITTLAPDTATTQATQASITTCVNLVSVGALTSGSLGAGFTDVPIAQGGTGSSTLAGASIPTYTSTNTFTNKRITARVWTAATDATPDVNSDNYDAVTITAQEAAITDVNMSGTPTNFQKLVFRILDDGTARAITWGSDFADAGKALPTTTVISKLLSVGFIYNTVTSKWGCVAVANET